MLDIYGQGNNVQKSAGYTAHPYYKEVPNLNNVTNKTVHRRKQRLVLGSLNQDSTMDYCNEFLTDKVNQFVTILLNGTEPADDTTWSTPRDMSIWSKSLCFGLGLRD